MEIDMRQYKGKQSVELANPPYVMNYASLGGAKEGEGPIGTLIDEVDQDALFGRNTWEEAESYLQSHVVDILLHKSGVAAEDIRYVFAGDLLGQLIATSFGLKGYDIPLFGMYGACSTFGEGMSLAAMVVGAGYANRCVALASSHFASAEKQFRYPLEYGNQRPKAATWTVTGAGAVLLESGDDENAPRDACGGGCRHKPAQKSHVRITGITTGKIVDYGVKDSMNMGACMAPAAASLIKQNLEDFSRTPKDYDLIITGDLGQVGKGILYDLLEQDGIMLGTVHSDCGIEIYDSEAQGTDSGGSGCGCSAVTLCAKYLPMLERGELGRILFVPTGALLSPTSFNEGKSVPGIAHGVVLEHC
jgi:stage V sporulation protein AD